MISVKFYKVNGTTYNFNIFDHGIGLLFSDNVRITEWHGTDRFSREALTPYGFWLDLKKFLNGRKLKLYGDVELMKKFHEEVNNILYRTEPWPFV